MFFNATTIFFLLPSVITLIVLRLRRQPWAKIFTLLGWRLGAPVYYLWALGLVLLTTLPGLAFVLLVLPDVYQHPAQGTTLYDFARLGFSFFSVLGAFLYEFCYTALGEEVFFRGLVGGWLMRRFGFWVGNSLQTLIFLLVHLPILLVGLNLWPLLIPQFLAGWLLGWLRYKSDSILPGMVLHGLTNTLSDVLAMIMG
jgi:uncharacterized protein